MRNEFLWRTTNHRSLFFYLFCNCCSLNTTVNSRWGGRCCIIFLLPKSRLFIVSTGTASVTFCSTASCWSKSVKGFIEAWATNDLMLRWLLRLRFLAWHVGRLRMGWSVRGWSEFAEGGIIISGWLVPIKFHLKCVITLLLA